MNANSAVADQDFEGTAHLFGEEEKLIKEYPVLPVIQIDSDPEKVFCPEGFAGSARLLAVTIPTQGHTGFFPVNDARQDSMNIEDAAELFQMFILGHTAIPALEAVTNADVVLDRKLCARGLFILLGLAVDQGRMSRREDHGASPARFLRSSSASFFIALT